MFLNTLSGRFLMLTIAFVMLAEVLIFVPSIARFREDYLLNRLERAQIASLAVLAAMDEPIEAKVEQELLDNAGVYNVVLRRDEMRELILSSPIPAPVMDTYDLREATAWSLIRDAHMQLLDSDERVIRVMGEPARGGGILIEVTLATAPLRAAMIEYGLNILMLSAAISMFTASLLFIVVRRFLVVPIRRVVTHMQAYAEAPEDVRRIIVPAKGVRELHDAEEALQLMQKQMTGTLKQKERLAALGGAVAKISHDLRNILTTATLLADRMESSADPAVQRSAPKLVNSLSRAVNLCESTLTFGRAEEPPPALGHVSLRVLVEDVLESERLALLDRQDMTLVCEVAPTLTIRGDSEQLHRILLNLVRNARQAIEATGGAGRVTVRADENDTEWSIVVEDSGPGLPERARAHLFTPFQGGARKGGTGLGLAIAAELVRGHGGKLELLHTSPQGTAFVIRLPKEITAIDAAAE